MLSMGSSRCWSRAPICGPSSSMCSSGPRRTMSRLPGSKWPRRPSRTPTSSSPARTVDIDLQAMSERSPAVPPVTRLLADQLAYHTRVLLRTPRAVVGGIPLPILLLLLRDQTSHPTDHEQVSLVAGLIAFGALSTRHADRL